MLRNPSMDRNCSACAHFERSFVSSPQVRGTSGAQPPVLLPACAGPLLVSACGRPASCHPRKCGEHPVRSHRSYSQLVLGPSWSVHAADQLRAIPANAGNIRCVATGPTPSLCWAPPDRCVRPASFVSSPQLRGTSGAQPPVQLRPRCDHRRHRPNAHPCTA